MEDNVPVQANVNTDKYADDCTMDTSVRTGELSHLQSALDSVLSWAVRNKMELNAKKTKDMWINFTGEAPPPPLRIGDTVIGRVDNFKLLGTWFQKDLKWNKHVEETTRKASKNLYCLRWLPTVCNAIYIDQTRVEYSRLGNKRLAVLVKYWRENTRFSITIAYL